MKIAFVACNRNPRRFREDASFIYRCENPSLALQTAGHDVELLHLHQLSPLSRYHAVVFHRPRWSPRLALAVALLRRRGAILLADFDDLVFDETFAQASPSVVNNLAPLGRVRREFKMARLALGLFARVTVSTTPLAEQLRLLFPGRCVEVVPNAVHLSWRALADRYPRPVSRKPIITYFPGTRSHDRDFAMVAEVLTHFLRRHTEFRLHVTGPLDFDLPVRSEQLVCRLKVPYHEFHEYFQEGWVNLAPLEATPFNCCKSAIKVMEAGFWNIPTICSAIADTRRFEGAGALLADNVQEWLTHLEALREPARYEQLCAGLRERVLAKAEVEQSAALLLSFINAGEG